MYAIVRTGGHQYKVAPGDVIEVERLEAEPGSQVELGEVLMVSGDDGRASRLRLWSAGPKSSPKC